MKSPSPTLQHPPSLFRLDPRPPPFLSCGISVWLLRVKLFEVTYQQIWRRLTRMRINPVLGKLRKTCHVRDLCHRAGGLGPVAPTFVCFLFFFYQNASNICVN